MGSLNQGQYDVVQLARAEMIPRGLCRAELRLAETDLFNLNVVLNIPGLSLVLLIFLPRRHVHVPQ